MRVTLYEPALAVGGKAYAGWANRGDELYFPHVDTCCALLIYGDKAVVGGHLGSQLPSMAEPNYAAAGRYVRELVVANHQRLNTVSAGCRVAVIGESNWFETVVYEIWSATDPAATMRLRTTSKSCPHGADIYATMDGIAVNPCGTTRRFAFGIPAEEYPALRDVDA